MTVFHLSVQDANGRWAITRCTATDNSVWEQNHPLNKKVWELLCLKIKDEFELLDEGRLHLSEGSIDG
jgi:hypothetical protein